MSHLVRARLIPLLAGAAAAAAVVWITLRFDLAGFDANALADQVRDTGMLGPVVLVGLLILQSVVSPLPSQPVLMAAGFLYGPAGGFAIGWLGVAAGACACFGLARALGRPFVERFVSAQRLAAVDAYVEGRGLRTIFLAVLSLRLFAHISFDVVSYASGLIRFPFGWFLTATAVGEIPKVFAFSYLGAGFGDACGWLRALILAGIFGTLVMWVVLARRAARQS